MKSLRVSTDPNDPYYQDRVAVATPFDRVAFARQFEHRRALVDGKKMHYVIGGTGPVIVFGHGWPASWWEWRKVLPLLADQFTCIAYDLPGLGDSDAPDAFDNRTVADMIHKLITEELGIEECFLVGHDVSGAPTVTLAAYHPELVKGVFLTESAISGPEMGDILAKWSSEVWHFVTNQSRLVNTLAIGREEQFIGSLFSDWVYNVDAVQELDEYIRAAKIPGRIETGAAYYRKAPNVAEDGGGPLPEGSLTMPLHFVGAELGFGGRIGGENQSAYKTIERYATNSSYEVLEKCSHWLAEDRPYTIATKMREFFSGIDV